MSQSTVTQSARKAFGNVSNVKGSINNTERQRIGLKSGKDAIGHQQQCNKDLKKSFKNCEDVKSTIASSCKKATENKEKVTKSVGKQAQHKQQHHLTKEKEKTIKEDDIVKDPLENFYPAPKDEPENLFFSPTDIFGKSDECLIFYDDEDAPNFIRSQLKFNLDLDCL